MNLYGYFLKRTADVHPSDWPPLAKAKRIEDAEHVELIDYPGSDKEKVFLYVVWPDKFKYLMPWSVSMLKHSIPDNLKSIFKKKRKIWSLKLEKSLLKDASPN